MAKIGAVHYAARDTAAGSVALLRATPFMRRRPIAVHGPARADLEAIVVALHVEFTRRADEAAPGGSAWLPDAWAAIAPDGVALGNALAATGELRRWRDDAVPIATVVDRLARALSAISRQPSGVMPAADG